MDNSETSQWLTFADFQDITSDALVVIDREQKIIIFNRIAEDIFGFTAVEIIGQSLDRLLPPRLIAIHRKHVEDFALEPTRGRRMAERDEIVGRRKNGSEFPAEATIAKLKRGSDVYFTISLRDLSNRKMLEQEQKKWSNAFQHAEWGVVIGQAESTTLDTMNLAFAKMHGYPMDELVGRPIKDVFVPEERDKLPEWLRQAHENGHLTVETRHLRKDGSDFPVLVDVTAVKDDNGRVLYRVVNVQDISDRKLAEQAVKESEARASSIIASLDEGIVLQDTSGVILICNSSAERILGLSSDQMMGRSSVDPRWNAIHEDGSPFPGENHPAMVTLLTGKPCTNVVMGINKPDGTRTWISINTQPLFHPKELHPYAVVASFTDITERLQTYHLLEQRVKERTRELTAVLDVSRDVASTLELKPLLKVILQRLKSVVDYTDAGIVTLDQGSFRFLEHQGQIDHDEILEFRVPVDQDSGYLRILRSQEPVNIGDIWSNDPWLQYLQKAAGAKMMYLFEHVHSWLGVPLITRDRVIGILRLDHTNANFFSEDRVRLVMAFADQAAVAIENARYYEHSQSLAALQERQKLARELHDSVAQALYGIALGSRTARQLMDNDPIKAAESLEYCISLADAGLAEMRALIFELRPESLELEGIVAALLKQTAALRARYALRVEESYCEEPQVPLSIKETIFRVAQEALHNVIKHAHATQIDLQLDQANDVLILEVKDNGRGFEISNSYPGHLGMKSMQERVDQAKGSFEIQSSPGQGTTIKVQIPVS
jgi:PAS domain S-box-containing protein